MTMDEYVKWLEGRIAVVGTEMEMLLNARKALEMGREATSHHAKTKRHAFSDKATGFDPNPIKPKPKPKPKSEPFSWQASTDEIIRLIRVDPSMTSGMVIAAYYPHRTNESLTKREKDRVYAVLSFLKQQGTIIRSPQGTWSLSAALTEVKADG